MRRELCCRKQNLMESFSALLAIYTHSRSHTHWNALLHSKIKVITNSLHSTHIRRLILVDKQRKIFSTEALDVVWCCRRTDRLVGLSTKSPNMEMVFAIFFFLCASISFWRGDFCLFWSNWVSKAGAQPEKMYAMQRTFQASLEYIYSFAMKNEATEREREKTAYLFSWNCSIKRHHRKPFSIRCTISFYCCCWCCCGLCCSWLDRQIKEFLYILGEVVERAAHTASKRYKLNIRTVDRIYIHHFSINKYKCLFLFPHLAF